ncbi:B-cell scaffold protein with ankyrin repeats [Gracilinanus agilis]|uniref:B-cell scaffold protein with ankyrin repeats n=1 Tax=Gracilinanus agilis TaxID=191870 RepID=UPI001CFC4F9A|nr:B-cell scaffold protein with ankyrin repeats [Gracilinanus agilis]
MALAENIKDLLMLYEEEAEEWALYLREVFLHVMNMEAILLYSLTNSSAQHLEMLGLNSYKCKLLILSNSLLQGLTPLKCRFLDTLLHSPESVVILLCGVKSSDELYELLTISPGSQEISTEQEPEDYISVIRSVIQRGSQNYFEVSNPEEIGMEHYIEINEAKEIERASETSESSESSVLVLPAKIPCEDPGDIFILLKDEIIGDIEIEFSTDSKCIRAQPLLWSKTVRCLKALGFLSLPSCLCLPPPGLHSHLHSEPALKASLEELDTILTSVFKAEIPHYDFRNLQQEMQHQENKQLQELPTLLHCAAKFGLKNFAVHLLQCSGASWASKVKNREGADPTRISESQGHAQLKRIFEEFSIREESRNDDFEGDYVVKMEDVEPSVSPFSPTMMQHTSHHHGRGQTYKEEGEEEEGEEEEQDDEDGGQERGHGVESEDDLYVVIPQSNEEGNSKDLSCSDRPPPPPPRAVVSLTGLEKPHCLLPVFQQKTTRPPHDGDKLQAPAKKPDRIRVDNQPCSALKCCIPSGQEELILLQEKVKTGEISVDEALKKFKQWQNEKSGLEVIQQEKLRQLRDCIIGKRPEEENFYDKITIVHHPDFKETSQNENVLYGTPVTSKVPPRPHIDKEYGFCWRKDN